MSSGSHEVRLHVYDLSGGMAMALSASMIGKHIEGIWHTGIVVYGKEYYYGGGLQVGVPGGTHYGTPARVETLGVTSESMQGFETFLSSIAADYSPQSYHLLDHNCNHFTAQAAEFLGVGPIPDYVSSLPEEFLSTPFGAMLRPVIDSMMGGMGGALGESVSSTPAFGGGAPPPTSSSSSFAGEGRSVGGEKMVLAEDRTPVAYVKFNGNGVADKVRGDVDVQNAVMSALGAGEDGMERVYGFIKAVRAKEERESLQVENGGGEMVDALLSVVLDVLNGSESSFPLLDIVRMAVLSLPLAEHLVEDVGDDRVERLWALVVGNGDLARGVRIMVFRLITNLLHAPGAREYVLANHDRSSSLLDALFGGLEVVDADPGVGKPAAAALHNLALIIDTSDMSDVYLRMVAGISQALLNVPSDSVPEYRTVKALLVLLLNAPHGAALAAQLGVGDLQFDGLEQGSFVATALSELQVMVANAM